MSLLNGSLSSRVVLVGLLAAIALMSLLPSFAEGEKPRKFWIFVGTYTGAPSNSKGIWKDVLPSKDTTRTCCFLIVSVVNPAEGLQQLARPSESAC